MNTSKKKDIRDIFKLNLRYYRLQNKMTQEDLATKSELTDKYISDLERGLFSPSLEKLDILADSLNIETYKLLKDEHNNIKLPNRLDAITKSRKSKKNRIK